MKWQWSQPIARGRPYSDSLTSQSAQNFPSPHSRVTGVDGGGGSKGPRAHFTRATISTFRLPHPLAPFKHRGLGTIPSGHLAGVGLDLMVAILAPHDQRYIGRQPPQTRALSGASPLRS
jgi:hypothetical protein